MIKDLARKLTAFTEFKDFVITEIEFRRGNFESGAKIIKNHASMVLLQANSPSAQVLVKIIRPRREIKAAIGSRINSEEKIWRIFTAQEILAFAEEIGDKNPIHRLNPPIVPAFLVLETIYNEFPSDFIKLKFKNFITAGEPLALIGNEIIGAGIRKVLITT